MSSLVILDNIAFKNNPSLFQDNLELQITFTAINAIPSLLEWRIIYVGSAKNEQYDQILQEFEIGPISEESTMKFTVDCPAPDYHRIPKDQLICVTALIITISYRNQEFIRVGYYVHNVLNDQLTEEERSNADVETLIGHTRRTILIDKPRITKFRINWGNEPMKEETNNNVKHQAYDSNNSLLANKMRIAQQENEEKQSTREEKDQNSSSLMKSEVNAEKSLSKYEEEVA